jgi:bifunctional non-homologous end joining protein LigD
VYVGQVGWGFTQRARVELAQRLAALAQSQSPFCGHNPEGVQWLRPALVGEVAYREFSGRLRHPSWKGLSDADGEAARIDRLCSDY